MNRIASVVMPFAVSAILSGPVMAQDNVAAPADASVKPAKEHKICREDVNTGSIMPHRTCHTREEWAEIDKADAANAAAFSASRQHSGGGVGH
jgi:hypothetical protein